MMTKLASKQLSIFSVYTVMSCNTYESYMILFDGSHSTQKDNPVLQLQVVRTLNPNTYKKVCFNAFELCVIIPHFWMKVEGTSGTDTVNNHDRPITDNIGSWEPGVYIGTYVVANIPGFGDKPITLSGIYSHKYLWAEGFSLKCWKIWIEDSQWVIMSHMSIMTSPSQLFVQQLLWVKGIRRNMKRLYKWSFWGKYASDSPHKGRVMQKTCPHHDIIKNNGCLCVKGV